MFAETNDQIPNEGNNNKRQMSDDDDGDSFFAVFLRVAASVDLSCLASRARVTATHTRSLQRMNWQT